LAEWLYESGIDENRAILVHDGTIIEAQIELDGLRAGTVADARLASILIPGRRGIAALIDGTEVLIEPLLNATEGAAIRIEILREAIPEPGVVKRAKGRMTSDALCRGANLQTRIGPHRVVGWHEPDLFEQAGWSECLQDAEQGLFNFVGGQLRVSLTPAMTLIDVDGPGHPAPLAVAGAIAAAQAIRRFGLAGNIGIDLPTVAGKAERMAIGAAFDAVLPAPFERTAVNGFGFLQVVRPRRRASLCEMIAADPAAAEARALIRRVQRSGHIGSMVIETSGAISKVIHGYPDWIDQLSRQLGGAVTIKTV
jgi:hypothetical protein